MAAHITTATTPDPVSIGAFLEPAHLALATTFGAFAARELAPELEPADDAAARSAAAAAPRDVARATCSHSRNARIGAVSGVAAFAAEPAGGALIR